MTWPSHELFRSSQEKGKLGGEPNNSRRESPERGTSAASHDQGARFLGLGSLVKVQPPRRNLYAAHPTILEGSAQISNMGGTAQPLIEFP